MLTTVFLSRVISQVIPAGAGAVDTDVPPDTRVYAERPPFTVAAMSNNFRRFNARIGVVFKFQARMIRLLSWRRPSQTLSLLAVYTFLCLNPYLLTVLPLVAALFGIFVPAFVARHPAAPSAPSWSLPHPADEAIRFRSPGMAGYIPRGPPLAPPRVVKPVKELSRDFFRNMGDLQNSMHDFSMAHDRIVALVVPQTNFSDEARSSALFVLLAAAAVFMSIAAHLLPWRLLALLSGWVGICAGHPLVIRLAKSTQAHYGGKGASGHGPNVLATAFDNWVASDIILDEAPETREVEMFELQRRSDSGEWEPWLFSPSPWDPGSAARLTGQQLPQGARFFEDVLPPAPAGTWEWSEKKWVLDLCSREWVEERIITGVEVETEGERWVYDMYNENSARAGVVEQPAVAVAGANGSVRGGRISTPVSWEESEEGVGRRGEWRRRRWVRMVKRKNTTSTTTA